MIREILRNVVLLGSRRNLLERETKSLRPFTEVKDLIPWRDEEIALLSLQLKHITKKSFFNTTVSGHFKTIYSESVIAYAYKDVYTGTKRGVILAKNNEYEYIYLLSKGIAKLYINGNAIGLINHHGRLIRNRSNSILAKIDQSDGGIMDITIDGVKVGSLNRPTKGAELHQRAVQLFKETSNKGMQYLVSLVLFEILKRNV